MMFMKIIILHITFMIFKFLLQLLKMMKCLFLPTKGSNIMQNYH
jgi:hypothetical protein